MGTEERHGGWGTERTTLIGCNHLDCSSLEAAVPVPGGATIDLGGGPWAAQEAGSLEVDRACYAFYQRTMHHSVPRWFVAPVGHDTAIEQ